MDLIKITPDKKRVEKMLEMIQLIEDRIKIQTKPKFTSLIISDYYEIIKELLTALLLLNGYKTLSHKDLTEYFKVNKKISLQEFELIDSLRIFRNRAVYEGFSVQDSYLTKNEPSYKQIIKKLKSTIYFELK